MTQNSTVSTLGEEISEREALFGGRAAMDEQPYPPPNEIPYNQTEMLTNHY